MPSKHFADNSRKEARKETKLSGFVGSLISSKISRFWLITLTSLFLPLLKPSESVWASPGTAAAKNPLLTNVFLLPEETWSYFLWYNWSPAADSQAALCRFYLPRPHTDTFFPILSHGTNPPAHPELPDVCPTAPTRAVTANPAEQPPALGIQQCGYIQVTFPDRRQALLHPQL